MDKKKSFVVIYFLTGIFTLLSSNANAGLLDKLKQQAEQVIKDTEEIVDKHSDPDNQNKPHQTTASENTPQLKSTDIHSTEQTASSTNINSHVSSENKAMKAQSSLANVAPEATFDSLLPLAIKFIPEIFRGDSFAVAYQASGIQNGSERCKEIQNIYRNEVLKQRIVAESKKNMKPWYDKADASPVSKVFYMSWPKTLGQYDFSRKAFLVSPVAITINSTQYFELKLAPGKCTLPVMMTKGFGVVLQPLSTKLYIPMPEKQAEILANNRNMKIGALVEVYQKHNYQKSALQGRIKQLEVLQPQTGNVLAYWNEEELKRLTNQASKKIQPDMPVVKRNKETVIIPEVEIQSVNVGMQHEQMQKNLISKKYTVQGQWNGYGASYIKKDGGSVRTVSIQTESDGSVSSNSAIAVLTYTQQFSQGVQVSAADLANQTIKRFGQPAINTGDDYVKTLTYWNWPDVSEAQIQEILPICNARAQKLIQREAQVRSKDIRIMRSMSPSQVMQSCPGTQKQMDTILKYMNVPIMVVKINGTYDPKLSPSLGRYNITIRWNYNSYSEILSELIKNQVKKQKQPKAKLDL